MATQRLHILLGEFAGQRLMLAESTAPIAKADQWAFDPADLKPGEPWPVPPAGPLPDTLVAFEEELRTFDPVTGYPTGDTIARPEPPPEPPEPEPEPEPETDNE